MGVRYGTQLHIEQAPGTFGAKSDLGLAVALMRISQVWYQIPS